MKNRITTNILRTIKKSLPRFLSLIIMSLLGVMVFVGLLATSPDMLITLDNYYDKNNVYDIKILSSMGLINDDISAIQKINNINNVEGIYSTDILLSNKENEYVVNISSLPQNINNIQLVQGKLPTKENEIAFEDNFIKKTKYKIGDTIKIDSDELIVSELKIVGTIESPLYFNSTNISQNRGTSSLGTGTVNYYSYVPSSSFDVDYYTYIYLSINNTKDMVTSTDN